MELGKAIAMSREQQGGNFFRAELLKLTRYKNHLEVNVYPDTWNSTLDLIYTMLIIYLPILISITSKW